MDSLNSTSHSEYTECCIQILTMGAARRNKSHNYVSEFSSECLGKQINDHLKLNYHLLYYTVQVNRTHNKIQASDHYYIYTLSRARVGGSRNNQRPAVTCWDYIHKYKSCQGSGHDPRTFLVPAASLVPDNFLLQNNCCLKLLSK